MPAHTTDPWAIRPSQFPERGTEEEKLGFCLRYALLAPSSHNSQPWRFRFAGRQVDLYADRVRALPVVDPEDRELSISCGAALYNLRLAMRHFGMRSEVELLPAGDADLLARVTLAGMTEEMPEEALMFDVITLRHTNRNPFEGRAVPETLLADLEAAARAEGAWLSILRTENSRHAVADLIAEADRKQMEDPRFRRELAAWIHPRRSDSHDGITPGGPVDAVLLPLTTLVIRTFDLGRGQAARDRHLASGSPVLAILGTESESVQDWLAAGQAMQRVLLRARADGVWASFLNQPIEVRELRPWLGDLTGNKGYVQLLLRMGYGPPAAPTPRRPLEQVMA